MHPNLYLCTLAVGAGIIFHFITKLAELEMQGTLVTPWGYWRAHPYTSLAVILGAYLFMALQFSIGELSYVSAFLTGISCNSIGDKLRTRAREQIDKVGSEASIIEKS